MNMEQRDIGFTVQRRDTSVPVGVVGERIGPARPSSSDYSTPPPMARDQARAVAATGPRNKSIRQLQADTSFEGPTGASVETEDMPYKRKESPEAFVLVETLEAITKLGRELATRIEQNTKREIKDISLKMGKQLDTLERDLIKKWLEDHRYEGVDRMMIDVDIQTDSSGITKGTQTEEDGILESLTSEAAETYEKWGETAEKQWAEEVFTNSEVRVGNPLNTKDNTVKVVVVGESSIKSLFIDRFPDLKCIEEDFAVLELSSKVRTRSTGMAAEAATKKVIKIEVDSERELFGKLLELREEVKDTGWVALHELERVSTARYRKMVEAIFHNSTTQAVVYTRATRREAEDGRAERRTYALVVEDKGKSYKDTLKEVKSLLQANNASDCVKQIRSTKEGKLLITTDRDETGIENVHKILQAAGSRQVHQLGEYTGLETLFIRGADFLTTKEEVMAALNLSVPGFEGKRHKVSDLRPMANDRQAFTLTVNGTDAKILLQKGFLRIGIVKCRVEKRRGTQQKTARARRVASFAGRTTGLAAANARLSGEVRSPERGIKEREKKVNTAIHMTPPDNFTGREAGWVAHYAPLPLLTKLWMINANRSCRAHDMALQTAMEEGVDVLVASEPNKRKVTGNAKWIVDARADVAICLMNNRLRADGVLARGGIVCLKMKEFHVYGCYVSPNISVRQFREYVDELTGLVTGEGREAIVLGDFNSKAPEWGAPLCDARGQLLLEASAARAMGGPEPGRRPHFCEGNDGTYIDVTFATQAVAARVAHWEVLDNEPLSPHRHILLSVGVDAGSSPGRAKGSFKGGVQFEAAKFVTHLKNRTRVCAEQHSARQWNRAIKDAYNFSKIRVGRHSGHAPYWWTKEVQEQRQLCIRLRRSLTRRRDPARADTLTEQYREARKVLRKCIAAEKKKKWSDLCAELNDNIWGDAYRLVKRSLKGGLPYRLSEGRTRLIAEALFPRSSDTAASAAPGAESDGGAVQLFTEGELMLACAKIKNNRAAGPDGVPPEAVKEAVRAAPGYTLQVLNALLASGEFPREWKEARLVLVPKPGKVVELPSSYRPLCLINSAAKIYEHLLKARLEEDIQRGGGLSPNQFGFIKGRCTLDAITVRDETLTTTGRMRAGAVWIRGALDRRAIPGYLKRVIGSYLRDRSVVTQDGERIAVTAGIPQGSVMGPILWDLFYDDVLGSVTSGNVTVLSFADDLAVVTVAGDRDALMEETNEALRAVSSWLAANQLEVAAGKTEAVILGGKRDRRDVLFRMGPQTIKPSKSLRYLGVTIGENLRFGAHVVETVRRAGTKLASLTRLLPNIGGPQMAKRALLYGVVQSVLLYGAPVWHGAVQAGKYRGMLESIQRRALLRVVCGYRTVSSEAIQVIAGIPHIDLLTRERVLLDETGERPVTAATRSAARRRTLGEWQDRWSSGRKGQWTRVLIPDLRRWVDCPHKRSGYFLTQALSGHGCFKEYLWRIGKVGDGECWYCGEHDSPMHTLFVCPRWAEIRAIAVCVDSRSPRMFRDMLDTPAKWKEGEEIVRAIMTTKCGDERSLGMDEDVS
ncbi:hypothetical protein HUJ04_010460 [Dendroctonus ponderosae]|nr:hypothetical protein HUJ04_010460 [Dendroctonus ponderosae]